MSRYDDDQENREVIHISRRMRMVDEQIVRRGVHDSAVLNAMRTVPRHLFLPEDLRDEAYTDSPQPIGYNQTISQPYIVASMTEELDLTVDCKVLEVGTGSGYQTAVLAEIARYVYSIEMIPSLLASAGALLHQLGYDNVRTMLGNGSLGWSLHEPFDAIIVTFAAPEIPQPLIDQLKPGGSMIIPVEHGGKNNQQLIKVVKTESGFEQKTLYPVRFVPMLGDPQN